MQNDIYTYKKEWFNFIDYKPHKGQRMLHNVPPSKRFVVACCGRRFGKSYAAAREAEVVLTQPGKVVWIVAPSYQTSEKIFRLVYENLVIKLGYKPLQYSAKEQILKFDWDGGISELRGKSAEHPSGLIGEGCDLVIVDEASKVPNFKRIWEMYVRPTLSDKKGKAIMISTPDGFSYFYELYLLGQTDINWYSFNSPSWYNHYAFPDGEADEDLVEARRTLSKNIYRQEFGAEFTALSGRVYNEFDRNLDTGDFGYIPGLPVFLSIDFGYRMPAALFFQHYKLADGLWHINIIDEIVHQKDLKVTDFAQLIKNKSYPIVRAFGDPAGYQVQSTMGVGEAEIFRQATGWQIFALRDKTSRSIASGISHVRNFICNVNGDRRLHINKNKCVHLVNDMESYRYADQKEGTDLKEIPLKDGLHDHSMDALRYYFVNQFPIKQYKYRTYK